MKNIFTVFFFATVFIYFSCSEISENDVSIDDTLIRIYKNDDFNAEFFPIDVKQTSDSGFLVLGYSNSFTNDGFPNNNRPYLMKIDAEGEFLWEYIEQGDVINPLNNLIEVNNTLYYFCMDEITLATLVYMVNEAAGEAQLVSTLGSLTYPVAASQNSDGSALVQGYRSDNETTYLSVIETTSFQSISTQEYEVQEDILSTVVSHVNKLDDPLPFFTGEVEGSGIYYFNGYENYNMSLHFTNSSDLSVTGGFLAIDDTEVVRAASSTTSASLAMARVSGGEIYLLPANNFGVTEETFVSQLGGFEFPELKEDGKIIVKKVSYDSEEYVLYGTETINGQILLLSYSITGELLATTYLGSGNAFELASFITTANNGLVVVGTTYVAGRFPRVALFKFSEMEYSEILGRL